MNRIIQSRILQVFLFLNVFVISAIFRTREFGSESIDSQILIKLGLWALALLFSSLFYRQWASKLFRIDNIFFTLLMLFMLASCFYAPSPVYSLGAAFSFLAVIVLLFFASADVDEYKIFHAIILACTLVSALSIAVYYINPQFGRMKEWIGGQYVPGPRLSGITGTANIIGYLSGFACLAIACFGLYIRKTLPLSYFPFFVLNFIALWMSNSRASLGAMILSVLFSLLSRPTWGRLAMVFLGFSALLLIVMSVDLTSFFAMIARTGDASEIATGTGRTYIWGAAMDLIRQRPFFGWGYGSTGYIMPGLEHNASHAHNMTLQLLVVTGLTGFFLFYAGIIMKIYYALKFGDQLKIALILFLLIQGLAEPSAFQGVANMGTLVLAMIIALDYRSRHEAGYRSSQQ